MGISTQLSSDQNSLTINISGQFNATVHREFRDAYKDRVKDPSKISYVVDLTHAEYMDSAALGMLLLLHEYAGGAQARVTIQHPNQYIRDILEIAKFDSMFTIL